MKLEHVWIGCIFRLQEEMQYWTFRVNSIANCKQTKVKQYVGTDESEAIESVSEWIEIHCTILETKAIIKFKIKNNRFVSRIEGSRRWRHDGELTIKTL